MTRQGESVLVILVRRREWRRVISYRGVELNFGLVLGRLIFRIGNKVEMGGQFEAVPAGSIHGEADDDHREYNALEPGQSALLHVDN